MANTYNTVTIGTSAAVIVAANTWRRGVTIFNNGGAIVYVGSDASITTANAIPVAVGSNYDFNGFDVYKGPIYGISGGTGNDVRYFEWTK